jgi:hypothetical protein
MPPDDEQISAQKMQKLIIVINWKQKMHLVGPSVLTYSGVNDFPVLCCNEDPKF